MKSRRALPGFERFAAAAIAPLLLTSCGYSVGGHADLVPKTVHTISIPAFTNVTTRYKLTDRLAEAVSREFAARTRYRIVSNPDEADAVLHGNVISYVSYPTVFDQATGRASGVELHLNLRLSLVERTSGKVLFNRPNLEARERYQISTSTADPAAYFDESDSALNRASQLVARQIVSAVLENF